MSDHGSKNIQLQRELEDNPAYYKRSSLCASGSCVEVAIGHDGIVKVRDNKDLTQAPLTFTEDQWMAFVDGVKKGEFDPK